jgi:hypothetical protein
MERRFPRDTAWAMSEKNVEFVRKAIEAFNAFMRGEVSREAILDLGDPQFEFH